MQSVPCTRQRMVVGPRHIRYHLNTAHCERSNPCHLRSGLKLHFAGDCKCDRAECMKFSSFGTLDWDLRMVSVFTLQYRIALKCNMLFWELLLLLCMPSSLPTALQNLECFREHACQPLEDDCLWSALHAAADLPHCDQADACHALLLGLSY